jgi:hypothetical protein
VLFATVGELYRQFWIPDGFPFERLKDDTMSFSWLRYGPEKEWIR